MISPPSHLGPLGSTGPQWLRAPRLPATLSSTTRTADKLLKVCSSVVRSRASEHKGVHDERLPDPPRNLFPRPTEEPFPQTRGDTIIIYVQRLLQNFREGFNYVTKSSLWFYTSEVVRFYLSFVQFTRTGLSVGKDLTSKVYHIGNVTTVDTIV